MLNSRFLFIVLHLQVTLVDFVMLIIILMVLNKKSLQVTVLDCPANHNFILDSSIKCHFLVIIYIVINDYLKSSV